MCKTFGSEIELFEYFRPFPAFYTHLGFRPRFAARKTFWVFDIVSSNEGVLCFWGLLWCLDHYVCYDPYGHLKPFLVFWGLLRCLDHYVYNWPLRVFYTFLSFWVRLWHLHHYVYVWPLRLSRPFCVFDIVSRVKPLWVRYIVCCIYTITSVCLTFLELI